MTPVLRDFLRAAVMSVAMAALACGDSAPSTGDSEQAAPDPPFIERADAVEGDIQGVVMIVVDTLRADHVGAYGSSRGLTPSIDALAERSHLFEHALATSSWTRPSIASMLTSRYPTSLGLLDKTDALTDGAVTLPEVLRNQAGFQTLAVITNANIAAQWGFDQGFDRFVWPHVRRRYPDDFPIRVAEGVTPKALELLDRRDLGRPFFLFVLYVDPHDPYLPHPKILPEPTPTGRFDGSRRELRRLGRLRLRAEPEDYDRIRHLYAGEVKYVDRWIGRLLDGLEERRLGDNVLILLTSDHGEGLWTHGRRGHGTDLYEESVHVPLLVKYPGMTKADAGSIAPPVSLVDLAPTILGAVGAPKPPSFQGFDLRPLTRGDSRGSAFEYVYTEMDHRNRNFEAIRRGDWKLIRNRQATGRGSDAVELYDLATDPAEQHSRHNDAPAAVLRPLADALRRWSRAVLADAASRSRIALSEIDEETLEGLRALGYIGNAELESARVAKRGGPAAETASGDLLEVALSELEFDGHPRGDVYAQVERGLSASATRSSGASMGREASVLLRTKRGHEKWKIDLIVEEEPTGGPVAFTAQAQSEEPLRVLLHESGSYVIEAMLPENVGPTLRLALRCDTGGSGDRPADGHCVTIRGILVQ